MHYLLFYSSSFDQSIYFHRYHHVSHDTSLARSLCRSLSLSSSSRDLEIESFVLDGVRFDRSEKDCSLPVSSAAPVLGNQSWPSDKVIERVDLRLLWEKSLHTSSKSLSTSNINQKSSPREASEAILRACKKCSTDRGHRGKQVPLVARECRPSTLLINAWTHKFHRLIVMKQPTLRASDPCHNHTNQKPYEYGYHQSERLILPPVWSNCGHVCKFNWA